MACRVPAHKTARYYMDNMIIDSLSVIRELCAGKPIMNIEALLRKGVRI